MLLTHTSAGTVAGVDSASAVSTAARVVPTNRRDGDAIQHTPEIIASRVEACSKERRSSDQEA